MRRPGRSGMTPGRRMLLRVRLSVGLGCTGEQESANRQFERSASEGFGKAAFVQNKRGKSEQASSDPRCASDQVGVWRLDDKAGHAHGEEEATVGRPDFRYAEASNGLDRHKPGRSMWREDSQEPHRRAQRGSDD